MQREFINIRIFNNKKVPAIFAYLWLEKIKPLLKKSIKAAEQNNNVTKDEGKE
jgi:hypothetical protein